MNNSITLAQSVLDADVYKVQQFHKDQNILKLLEAIKDDDDFTIVDGVVEYLGEKRLNGTRLPKAQRVKTFRPLSQPQVILNYDRAPVNLVDIYRGCTGFLILSGPSARELDLSQLERPGLLKMCVNNSSRLVRPNLWTCVDPPDRFLYSVWTDPTIMKFAPDSFREKSLWDTYKDQPILDRKVGDCPSVYYYPRNTNFVPGTWLTEASINWGQNKNASFYDPELGKKVSGTRSCMLVAIRIMAMLGVRTIFLVGADFRMDEKQPYAFDQGKHKGGVHSNNNAYQALNSFFNVLQPHFKAIGLSVYNTNPNSGLKTFPHIEYQKAIDFALSDVGDPSEEITSGMYDNIKDKRKRAKAAGKSVDTPIIQGVWDPDTYELIPEDEIVELDEFISEDKVKRAQKGKLDYVGLLEERDYWTGVYPDLKDIADSTWASYQEALTQKGGCPTCKSNRITRPFAAAVVGAINDDPDTLENDPDYRPELIIRTKHHFFKLEDIVAGRNFAGQKYER
jgi:hypothetical protein